MTKAMKRGLFLVPLLTGLLVGALVGPAWAKPVTMTFHEKKEVFTFHDVIPCIGSGQELGTITVTETGVFHVTAAGIDDNGTPDDPSDDTFIPPFHTTGAFHGTFEAAPDDSSLPTFTGHYAQRFGENSNKKNDVGTFTFTVIGQGSDGSTIKFHETAHFSVNPNGVTQAFDKPTCH